MAGGSASAMTGSRGSGPAPDPDVLSLDIRVEHGDATTEEIDLEAAVALEAPDSRWIPVPLRRPHLIHLLDVEPDLLGVAAGRLWRPRLAIILRLTPPSSACGAAPLATLSAVGSQPPRIPGRWRNCLAAPSVLRPPSMGRPLLTDRLARVGPIPLPSRPASTRGGIHEPWWLRRSWSRCTSARKSLSHFVHHLSLEVPEAVSGLREPLRQFSGIALIRPSLEELKKVTDALAVGGGSEQPLL